MKIADNEVFQQIREKKEYIYYRRDSTNSKM